MEETVFVVDGDKTARGDVARLLEAEGYSVSAFESAEAFLEAVDPAGAGCVVLEVRLPGMSGAALQQELARRASRLSVVFLTGHADVAAAVSAIKAGARDVLTKPADAATLLRRIKAALSESEALQAELAALKARLGALTAREREVLLLVAEGRPNKEIAARLGISFRTVEIHRAHVLKKTCAANVLELAHLVEAARRVGLLR